MEKKINKIIKELEDIQENLDTDIFAQECNNWYGQYCNGVSDGIEKAIEILKAKIKD